MKMSSAAVAISRLRANKVIIIHASPSEIIHAAPSEKVSETCRKSKNTCPDKQVHSHRLIRDSLSANRII